MQPLYDLYHLQNRIQINRGNNKAITLHENEHQCSFLVQFIRLIYYQYGTDCKFQ